MATSTYLRTVVAAVVLCCAAALDEDNETIVDPLNEGSSQSSPATLDRSSDSFMKKNWHWFVLSGGAGLALACLILTARFLRTKNSHKQEFSFDDYYNLENQVSELQKTEKQS